MVVKCRFDHYNINVFDLEKSIKFYDDSLGLKEVRRIEAADGSYIIVYLNHYFMNFYKY